MNYDIRKTDHRLTLDIKRVGQLSISVLVLYYMCYNEKYGHNALIVYGAFLVMCGSLAIELIKDRELSFENYYIGAWWNFVIVAYAFSTGIFVAHNIASLLEGIRLVLQYSIIVFAIYYFANKSVNGIKWLLFTINLAALICCYFLLTGPVEKIRGRYSISFNNNPNTLGFMLVIGIFSIAYRFKADIKWIVLNIPQIILMIYGIVLTGSRKALISAVILVILWVIETIGEIIKHKDIWEQLVLIILFVVALSVGVRFILSVYNQSEIALRMEHFLDDESNGNRINYYRLAWQILLNKPLFGGGLDQFKYWSGVGGYAHSTYAEAIADFGTIGSLLYFFPIIDSGYRLFQRTANKKNYFQTRIVLALWIVEILIGLGQIFFVDIMHYISWTIIYINVTDGMKITTNSNRYKYVRN